MIGGELLQRLLLDESVEKVHLWGRVESPDGQASIHDKLIYKQINFDELEHLKFPDSLDACFCCLGTTMKKAGSKEAFAKVDYDYVLSIASKAKKHHISHFLVISAIDANVKSNFFYNRVKGKMEQALLALNFQHLSIFRPALLNGKRKESRFLEELGIKIMKLIGPLFVGKLKNYKMIKAEKVAIAMIKAAKKPNGTQILESFQMQ